MTTREMGADAVVELVELCESHGVQVWLDGGWAVDALLDEQTRRHGDVDLALNMADLPALRALLEERGYRDKGEEHATPWNYVMRDGLGHEVDLHAFVPDADGNGVLGPPDGNQVYPAHSFTGRGSILGRPVRCVAVEELVAFHAGYDLDADDCRDVVALCERFGLEIPAEVRAAAQSDHDG